ncbi:hypothetical protein PG984_005221 [Apiospora sp. TS-2023a]
MSTATSGSVLIGVTMMTEVLAAGSIGLRLWSRHLKKRKFFAHDVFIISAFICSTALEVGLLIVATQLFWCFAMTSVRFSILHLYINLFYSHYRFRLGFYVILALCASWAVGETLIAFLLCRPASSWGQLAVGGTCKYAYAANISIHSTNFILDSSVGLIPIMVLKDLKMLTRRKVGIGSMFALGALLMLIC